MRYFWFLVFYIFTSYTFAENILEFRSGYFRFDNSTARDIYGNGTITLELENNYKFKPRVSLWGNFNASWKKGSSLNVDNPTHLYLYTLSVGPKFFLTINKTWLDLYLGAGLSGAYLHLRDDTSYLPDTTKRLSAGIVGKTGFLISLNKAWILDLFFDYYYQPVSTRQSSSLTKSTLNIGGFRTGAGIGYRF